VEFEDFHGISRIETFDGFPARVLHHEIDHLDGVLYSDRLRSGSELLRADLFPSLE
jgi:peptide deformylase